MCSDNSLSELSELPNPLSVDVCRSTYHYIFQSFYLFFLSIKLLLNTHLYYEFSNNISLYLYFVTVCRAIRTVSIYLLTIYLSIYINIYLHMCRDRIVSVKLTIYICTYMSIYYLHISVSMCRDNSLLNYQNCLLSDDLCRSTYLSIYLHIYISIV